MTKQASIAYISDLLEHPARIAEADQSSIAGFRQSFPYFVPARYLEAYHKHKASPWAPEMLSAVMPYTGNWVLFCEFLNLSKGNYVQEKRGKNKREQDDRPILKAQTVIADQKEVVPPVEEIKPEVVVAVEEPVLAAEVPVAPVEEVNTLPEPVPAIVEEATMPEAVVAEPVIEAVAKEEQAAIAEQVTAEERPIAEEIIIAPETSDVEIAAVMPMAEEPIVNVMEEVPVNQIDEDALEELENRHNNFWTQGDEATTETATETMPEAGTNDTIVTEAQVEVPQAAEIFEEVEEMTSYVPTGNEKPLIYPVYTEDYFLTQGEKVPNELPEDEDIESLRAKEEAKSLMVMMSFSEWLLHFKSTTERQKEENKDQKALKTMWQKEKLAAAIEEENEEIPENVFEMAVNSITKEDGLASEALANIYVKQGKFDKAVDMYRKLSLRNPQKNAYFARKIEDILKEKKS